MAEISVVESAEVQAVEHGRLRQLLDDAFEERFTDDDWEHALGGWHVVATIDDIPVSHVAVIPRWIEVGARRLDVGYIEAVATTPSARRGGLATRCMRASMDVTRREFEMGVLSTSSHRFYERLGWERWLGPSFVNKRGQRVRTTDEDQGIMVLRYGPSADVPLDEAITCHERPGDDW